MANEEKGKRVICKLKLIKMRMKISINNSNLSLKFTKIF